MRNCMRTENILQLGGSLESVNKPKLHKRSMPVYAYPTCSDRHIRTFFFGFGGTDSLLWLTREWQVVGCTYYNSAFNKMKKRQREQTESVNKPKTHKKKYACICLSDSFGQTHTDILLRLRRYGQPFVAHP